MSIRDTWGCNNRFLPLYINCYQIDFGIHDLTKATFKDISSHHKKSVSLAALIRKLKSERWRVAVKGSSHGRSGRIKLSGKATYIRPLAGSDSDIFHSGNWLGPSDWEAINRRNGLCSSLNTTCHIYLFRTQLANWLTVDLIMALKS
jgi:hypothetical protein